MQWVVWSFGGLSGVVLAIIAVAMWRVMRRDRQGRAAGRRNQAMASPPRSG